MTDSIAASIERSYIILRRSTCADEMSGRWSTMIEINGLASVEGRFLERIVFLMVSYISAGWRRLFIIRSGGRLLLDWLLVGCAVREIWGLVVLLDLWGGWLWR
jgi:hypothetical protein